MMQKRPNSLRLQSHDYAESGAYFVIIVTYGREAILGEVKSGQVNPSKYGTLVANIWRDLPSRYNHIVLDEFIVMPDHIHGIVWTQNTPNTHTPIPIVGAGSLLTSNVSSVDATPQTTHKPALTIPRATSRDGSSRAGFKSTANNTINGLVNSSVNEPAPTGNETLSEIIRGFKTVSAKRINLLRRLPGTPIWQRGFHDRIIRNEDELNAFRLYIQTNPQRRAEQL